MTKGMDFSVEDHLDSAKFNQVVWEGVMGDKAYPSTRSGADLRQNRPALLAKYHAAPAKQVSQPSAKTTPEAGTSPTETNR